MESWIFLYILVIRRLHLGTNLNPFPSALDFLLEFNPLHTSTLPPAVDVYEASQWQLAGLLMAKALGQSSIEALVHE